MIIICTGLTVLLCTYIYILIGYEVYKDVYTNIWSKQQLRLARSQGLSLSEAVYVISLHVTIERLKWPYKLYKDRFK